MQIKVRRSLQIKSNENAANENKRRTLQMKIQTMRAHVHE